MSHGESSPAAGRDEADAQKRPVSDGSASPPRAEGVSADAGEPGGAERPDTDTVSADAKTAAGAVGAVAGGQPDTGSAAAESETPEEEEAPKGPKMVRRVVVSYQLGWLPGDWLQTWRRLDRTFARADLQVKAILAPLEDLPPETDILVVPPELREAAREAALPGTPILVTPASSAAGAFADLVSRLQAGTEFTAEKVDPDQADKPRIVSYRGHTIIE
jgi:hypothetical protein